MGINCRNTGWVLRQFSVVRRAGCPWRGWFGIKGLQSQAGQRYLWTVTSEIDSPLVVSPGDYLKSLPTFFFNDLYEIQYFGVCVWINPELVHSIPPVFLPPSFSSFVDGPTEVGDALGTGCSPLCSVAGVEQTAHGCVYGCGHVARAQGLQAHVQHDAEEPWPRAAPPNRNHSQQSSHGTRTQHQPPAQASLLQSWE